MTATGAVDLVTNGRELVEIANGASMMARVTGMGCALSAAVAAFVASSDDRMMACVAAAAVFGVVGARAARRKGAPVGPGTFRVNFIDGLFDVSPDALMAALELSVRDA